MIVVACAGIASAQAKMKQIAAAVLLFTVLIPKSSAEIATVQK